MFTYLIVLLSILQIIICEQVITANLVNYQTSLIVQVGTPLVSQKLSLIIGKLSSTNLGQFLFDQSIMINDNQYYETFLKDYTLYDMKKSTTAVIDPKQTKEMEYEDEDYGGYILGNNVQDVLQVGDTVINYSFLCATYEKQLYSIMNGLTFLNRYQNNIFDLMYQQDKIKSSDYVMKMSSYEENYLKGYKIDLHFDLDKDSEYYSYPSNRMIPGDEFLVKAHGVYYNDIDVTDYLKHLTINFDTPNLNSALVIPTDLNDILRNDPDTYNAIIDGFIYSCFNCECPQVQKLPKFKIVTEEYVFEINPQMYLEKMYNPDTQQTNCRVSLQSYQNYFYFQTNYQTATNTGVMYQKETNSLKFIGVDTVSHMNLKYFMIIMSLLNSLSLISLVSFSIFFAKTYNYTKKEYLQQIKYKIK